MNSKEIRFQIKSKDIGARIGELEINGKKIETPAIMPVYNPNKPIISIDELRDKFKIKILMVNSYILYKNSNIRERVIEKGIHKFLNFDGIIATDSGSYQLMQYGSVSVSNKEIIKFQEDIGTDIGSFLDIPTLPNAYKPRAVEQLELTLMRAKEAENAKFVVNAGIQGSLFPDLRRKSAREIGKRFSLCAIGGIVRLMEDYRFSELIDVIAVVKKNLPLSRVVHAFGLGHPITLAFAISLGCDLFDSASYALYAMDLRYMTEYGTERIEKLHYLPCSCPVCEKYDVEEFGELPINEKIRELARHNLYVTIEELRRIKQAIRENSLWELLSVRARAHPSLLLALKRLMRHNKFLSRLDPITKKSGFFYLGGESRHRTEVVNVRERIKRVSSRNMVRIEPFGDVPIEIVEMYPFISLISRNELIKAYRDLNLSDFEIFGRMLEYQFGSNASEVIKPGRIRIKRSKSGRIRYVYENNEIVASVRASDHFIIPKMRLAERLRRRFSFPLLRVVVDDDAVPFIREGKSVFAKFVIDIDKNLRARDEVLVVDGNDNLIAIGTLMLSPREVIDFDYGIAVRTR